MRRVHQLAALLLVTIVSIAGCRENEVAAMPRKVASITVDGSACRYVPATTCPNGGSCNPPPAMIIDCPRELVDAPADPTRDDYRPPNRAGWLRVKEQLRADAFGCFFDGDHYCPPRHMDAPCDPARSEKVKCEPLPSGTADAGRNVPAANRHQWQIETFLAHRSGDRCVRYPAFVCEGPNCELPKGELVDCDDTQGGAQ